MDELRVVDKAYAYVTRGRAEPELLVFDERNGPADLQVPKGTVEPGERPDVAVLRELYEEAGVTDVEGVAHLSTDTWRHPYKEKRYRRHFFHVPVGAAPDSFTHAVTGDGDDVGDVYDYEWHDPARVDVHRGMDEYAPRVVA